MTSHSKRIALGGGDFQVAARPRGEPWLRTDLQHLHDQGIRLVASLLTEAENRELALQREAELAREVGLEFLSFPILDRSVPPDRTRFEQFASDLFLRINSGISAHIHCRAGLGRAPLLGCAILVQSGLTREQAWELLAAQKVPDTDEQRAWVRNKGMSLDDALRALGSDQI